MEQFYRLRSEQAPWQAQHSQMRPFSSNQGFDSLIIDGVKIEVHLFKLSKLPFDKEWDSKMINFTLRKLQHL